MNVVKRKVFEAAICKGMVTVHVVPAEGLALPIEAPCSLHYGLNMPRQIPDLDVGPLGIGATLIFSGQPVPTFVPWDAVVALALPDPLFLAQWPREVKVVVPPVEPRRLRAVD